MLRSKALSPWQRNKRRQNGVRIEESTQKFATSPQIEFFFALKLSLPISLPVLQEYLSFSSNLFNQNKYEIR